MNSLSASRTFSHQRSFNLRKVLPVFPLVVFFCSSTLARSQTPLVPTWTALGWHQSANAPEFSLNGGEILLWNKNAFEVYRMPTATAPGMTLRLEKVYGTTGNATITGACLSPNGTTVYYSTTEAVIYSYNVASRVQVPLTALTLAAGKGARLMKTSADGTELLFVFDNPSTSKDRICLYKLSGNYSSPANFDCKAGTTASVDFLGTDKLVTSGPTVYDYSGNALLSGSNNAPVIVSPTGATLYTYDYNYAYAFNSTNLNQVWRSAPPAYTNTAGMALSRDGNALFFAGQHSVQGTANWVVAGLNTTSHATLASTIDIATGDTSIPTLAANPSPQSDELMIGPGSYAQGYLYSCNTGTGAGSLMGTLFQGQLSSPPGGGSNPSYSMFTAGRLTAKNSIPPVITADEFSDNGTATLTIRNSETGAVIGTLPQAGEVLDPTGKFYALVSNGVTVFDYPSGNVAGPSYTGAAENPLYWGGSTIIANHSAPFDLQLIALKFTGTGLSVINTYGWYSSYQLSPDGTVLAGFFASGGEQGVDLYAISPSSNSSFGRVVLGSGSTLKGYCLGRGVLAFERLTTVSGVNTFQCDLYSTSGSTLKFLETISYNAGSGNFAFNGGPGGWGAALSQDGAYLAIGHAYDSTNSDPRATGSVRVYSVANGSLVSRWDDQLLPDFYGSGVFVFGVEDTSLMWPSLGGWVAAPVGAQIQSLTLSPSLVVGGNPSTGKITLTAPAPAPGLSAQIFAPSTVTVPSKVPIATGSTSATFPIETKAETAPIAVTIVARVGVLERLATLTVTPQQLLSLTFVPPTVTGGYPSTGVLRLVSPDGTSDAVVTLSGGDMSVSYPANVTIIKGATAKSFSVTTAPVSANKVETISATLGKIKKSATLTLTIADISSFTFSPTAVTGGEVSTGIIRLGSKAGPSGDAVRLSGGDASVTYPSTVTVAAATTAKSFQIGTTSVNVVTNETITATLGSSTKVATLTLNPVTMLACRLDDGRDSWVRDLRNDGHAAATSHVEDDFHSLADAVQGFLSDELSLV